MRYPVYAAVAAVSIGMTFVAAQVLGWPYSRAALLAPVIVACVGAIIGLCLLWARVIWESLQRSDHPWRIVAIAVGAIVLLVGLTVLGIKLPKE